MSPLTASSGPTLATPRVERRARQSLLVAALAALVLLAAVRLLRPATTPLPITPPGVDPNTASRQELVLLPGVGEALAERIIAHRESSTRRPAFSSAAELDEVRGIGPVTIERLRPHLLFSASQPTSPGRADAPGPSSPALAEESP